MSITDRSVRFGSPVRAHDKLITDGLTRSVGGSPHVSKILYEPSRWLRLIQRRQLSRVGDGELGLPLRATSFPFSSASVNSVSENPYGYPQSRPSCRSKSWRTSPDLPPRASSDRQPARMLIGCSLITPGVAARARRSQSTCRSGDCQQHGVTLRRRSCRAPQTGPCPGARET